MRRDKKAIRESDEENNEEIDAEKLQERGPEKSRERNYLCFLLEQKEQLKKGKGQCRKLRENEDSKI